VNLLISFIFHTIIVLVMFILRRGRVAGKQMKKIAVEMVKEKLPEKPKELEKPKVEPPKWKRQSGGKTKEVEEARAAPPPATVAPRQWPTGGRVAVVEFEGGKAVETSSDAVQIYKGTWNTRCGRNGFGRTTSRMTITWPR